jgi:hypothetical protein
MNKITLSLVGLLTVALVWMFAIQSREKLNEADFGVEQTSSTSPIYKYTWPAQELTGTQNDTFLIPTLLHSLWNYNYTIDVTMDADTASFVAILQESNKDSGTQWYELERDSVANLTTSTTVRLYGTDLSRSMVDNAFVRGRRHRLVFDVFTGTGDTLTVSPVATLKKN